MRVHVLYENPDWMPPLRRALASRGVPFEEHFVDGGALDLADVPPEGVVLNRMSPSAHTRDHQGGVVHVQQLLAWLEAHGRRVINGSRAFSLEVSKVRQDLALRRAGILTPRTLAVVGRDPRSEARRLPAPFVTKHNQGGKGLGVRLFRSHEAFDEAVARGEIVASPDGVLLLQAYVAPREPRITRVEIVDGRFLYAVHASTENGFELCPADACAVDEAFCPVGESGTFRRVEGIGPDDPLVRRYVALCRSEGLDVAGIEFVEDAEGVRYTYDINGTTNYNGALEAAHGLDGMGAVAALCARELAAASARRVA